MIAQWMLYSVATGACFAVVGIAGESLLRSTQCPGRWAWVLTLLASLGLPILSITLPEILSGSRLLPSAVVGELNVIGSFLPGDSAAENLEFLGGDLLNVLLVVAWSTSSVTLLGLVAWATTRLIRERRSWLPATIGGARVLVSETVGPAVVGFWEHALVVPRWVLDLSDEERRLVVLHEEQHASAGDLYVLFGGLLAVVLVPWNPAIWWQVRRLRLAVEADCDARVLRCGTEPQSYGAFLLNVCSRVRNPRVAAVALSERRSPLLRRIELMSGVTRRRFAHVGLALVSGVIALTLACEIPAPVIAPNVDNSIAAPQSPEAATDTDRVFPEYQVDEPPRLVVRPPFEYPEELLDDRAEGVVRLETIVGIDGNLEPGSSRVIESSNERFDEAALHYLNQLGFTPGLVDGNPVRVLIRFPIQFSVVGGN